MRLEHLLSGVKKEDPHEVRDRILTEAGSSSLETRHWHKDGKMNEVQLSFLSTSNQDVTSAASNIATIQTSHHRSFLEAHYKVKMHFSTVLFCFYIGFLNIYRKKIGTWPSESAFFP